MTWKGICRLSHHPLLVSVFATWSHYVAQFGLEFMTLLSLLPEYRSYRHILFMPGRISHLKATMAFYTSPHCITITSIQFQNISSSSKAPHFPPMPSSSPWPQPTCFLCLWTSLFWAFGINRTAGSEAFCVWTLTERFQGSFTSRGWKPEPLMRSWWPGSLLVFSFKLGAQAGLCGDSLVQSTWKEHLLWHCGQCLG